MEGKKLSVTNNPKVSSLFRLASIIVSVIIIASAAKLIRFRIDLTEDHRFTLSQPTREILGSLPNDIFIQVYLDGDMPVPLKRLRRSVMEMLEEFRIASEHKVDFKFINPSEDNNEQKRNSIYESLIKKGLAPINIQAAEEEGGSTQKIIFPGMIVNYNGIEVPVNFLKNNPALPYEENILHSAEALEYEIIQTISTLAADTVYRIAFIEGHDEFPEISTADITYNLAKFFTIDRGTIGGRPGSLDNYAAVVVAGPEQEFSEPDKFVLDQYLMNGGKILWLLEEVHVNKDSLAGTGETVALYRTLNLEDQLFRYGARINPVIIQDLDCQQIRLKLAGSDGRQQYVPVHWIYNPLLTPDASHPVTRNINKVKGEFTGYIDTVGLDPSVKKHILLTTSPYTRKLSPPAVIALREAEYFPDEKEFSNSFLPVSVLYEGVFQSAFRNRMVSSIIEGYKGPVKTESTKTKMIVVADGDIIRNEIRRNGPEEIPVTLGLDSYNGITYGNRDFLINCMNYLVDDRGIMELRSRELKIRLLDRNKIREQKLKWQLINVAGPVILVIFCGLIFNFFRKRNYS
ncbi:MAG TPA: gliding motility-associated ABC transporter substrate-binding protein GldG [Bacteroidales bacterium]|nr:gliding motility-associated ABC transporter substrate-binding protein GldG [Bacteroidales bacterium]